MSLTKNQIKYLRGLCHDLHPVVMLGQKGLTQEVLAELEIALTHHELVKIKLAGDDRDARQQVAAAICESSHSEVVQAIGKTVSVFRRNPKKTVVVLPEK